MEQNLISNTLYKRSLLMTRLYWLILILTIIFWLLDRIMGIYINPLYYLVFIVYSIANVFIVKRGQGQEQSNTPSSQLRGSTIRPKLLSKPFAALYDFGCEHVYVCHKSLNARGLCTDDLTVEHELVSRDQIATLIDQHDEVLVF